MFVKDRDNGHRIVSADRIVSQRVKHHRRCERVSDNRIPYHAIRRCIDAYRTDSCHRHAAICKTARWTNRETAIRPAPVYYVVPVTFASFGADYKLADCRSVRDLSIIMPFPVVTTVSPEDESMDAGGALCSRYPLLPDEEQSPTKMAPLIDQKETWNLKFRRHLRTIEN